MLSFSKGAKHMVVSQMVCLTTLVEPLNMLWQKFYLLICTHLKKLRRREIFCWKRCTFCFSDIYRTWWSIMINCKILNPCHGKSSFAIDRESSMVSIFLILTWDNILVCGSIFLGHLEFKTFLPFLSNPIQFQGRHFGGWSFWTKWVKQWDYWFGMQIYTFWTKF